MNWKVEFGSLLAVEIEVVCGYIMVFGGWKHEVLGSILKDFVFERNGFEWMLGFQFLVDFSVFVDGFKLVLDVSRYEEPGLIDVFVDFEDLVLFVCGFLKVRISNWIFLEIESLFVEINDGFMFRRSIIVNVDGWVQFLSVESRVELFW